MSGGQIWGGVWFRNLVDIKSYPDLHFEGALWFVDKQGSADPKWQGLGERYALLYAAESEALPSGVQSARYQGAASAADGFGS